MKDRDEKKLLSYLFWRQKLYKIELFYFLNVEEKNLGQFSKHNITFYPKILYRGSEIRDPRSGIRKKPIPDPRSRGQKGTGSRIWIRNTDRHIKNK
jgi:hypothetical protein